MKVLWGWFARKECPVLDEFTKDIEKERTCQGRDRLFAVGGVKENPLGVAFVVGRTRSASDVAGKGR